MSERSEGDTLKGVYNENNCDTSQLRKPTKYEEQEGKDLTTHLLVHSLSISLIGFNPFARFPFTSRIHPS